MASCEKIVFLSLAYLEKVCDARKTVLQWFIIILLMEGDLSVR